MLKTEKLTKVYGDQVACHQLSIEIEKGQIVGLIGESGCGKTTLAMMLAGLTRPTNGEIFIEGDQKRLPFLVQLVFQHSSQALNPKLTVRAILEEPLRIQGLPQKGRAEEALESVLLSPTLLDRFPAQLSGGQKQRVNIARALMLRPKLLILDEAFASQDEETKRGLLLLLSSLKERHQLTYLLISHDLQLVGQMADRLYVMYAGKLVEWGDASELLKSPSHPYTQALLYAAGIDGAKPLLLKGDFERPKDPTICPLARRCPLATAHCQTTPPPLHALGATRFLCHRG